MYPDHNVYLDITTEQEGKVLETLEDENQRKIAKRWETKNWKLRIEMFLGLHK